MPLVSSELTTEVRAHGLAESVTQAGQVSFNAARRGWLSAPLSHAVIHVRDAGKTICLGTEVCWMLGIC